MLIFDGDYPMALGVAMNRDLTRPVEEVRTPEPHAGTLRGWPDKEVMATIPEIRRGEIGAALVKAIACIKRPGYKHGECRTDEIAYEGSRQIRAKIYAKLESLFIQKHTARKRRVFHRELLAIIRLMAHQTATDQPIESGLSI